MRQLGVVRRLILGATLTLVPHPGWAEEPPEKETPAIDFSSISVPVVLLGVAGLAGLAALLAGSSGGDGGQTPFPPDEPPPSLPPSNFAPDHFVGGIVMSEQTIDQFQSHWFGAPDKQTITDFLNDPEYQRVRPFEQYAHPYTIMNVPYAWALGFTGRDQVIAISDNREFGYSSNPEFDGRIIGCWTNKGTDPDVHCNIDNEDGEKGGHGMKVTHVAAGAWNGVGTVGVAPDANVMWLEWGDQAGAVEAAINAGATAFNMSWGWSKDDPPIQFHLNSDFVAAMQRFGKQGVTVVSLRNDDLPIHDPAQAPHYYPELKGTWIAAANALFDYDEDTGEIWVAEFYSAECGIAAEWCLTGQGLQFIMDDLSNGASYSSPEFSAIQLHVEAAHPDSSPAERVARQLASANNTYFLPGGKNYDPAVELEKTRFGDCIEHTYSPVYGHGTPDVFAAINPICDLTYIWGKDLATGIPINLGDASLVTPEEFSAAVRDQMNMVVAIYDGLNGKFTMPGEYTVQTEPSSVAHEHGLNSQSAALAFAMQEPVSFAFGSPTSDGARAFHVQSADISDLATVRVGFANAGPALSQMLGDPFGAPGIVSLAGSAAYTGLSIEEGHFEGLQLFAFAGRNAYHDGDLFGLGGRFTRSIKNTRLSWGARLFDERGSFMGLNSAADLWFGESTTVSAWSLSMHHAFSERVSAFATVETGIAFGQPGRFVTDLSPALFSSAKLGIELNGLFQRSDRLSLWASQPMRFEDADVTLRLPSGRTQEGVLLYETFRRNFTPDSRQIDLGFNYVHALDRDLTIAVGATHSINAGHEAGKNAFQVDGRMKLAF